MRSDPRSPKRGNRQLSPTSFGAHSAKVLVGPNEGRIMYETGG